MIKQHAILMGDCVFVYDPKADAIVEYTKCFDSIVGIESKNENVKQNWLNKIEHLSEDARDTLFNYDIESKPVQFEYLLTNDNGSSHRIKHISYPYLNAVGQLFVLIILRDHDLQPQSILEARSKVEDWRQLGNSQLRHIRKLIGTLYQDSKADFVMLALPIEGGKSAKSLVGIQDGKFFDELIYDLKGTPCDITAKGKICTHKKDIQKLYPEDKMLVEMSAESYAGVPFFNDQGKVLAYLVIISRAPLTDRLHFHHLLNELQPKLNRRLQLYITDQHLSELGSEHFDIRQFSLGATPSTEEFHQWSNLSAETFNSVKEAIFITDADNRIIQINKAFSDITGYSIGEILGKTPGFLSSGQHDQEFYQKMRDSLEQHGMWEGEIINKNKQGKLFSEWLYIRVIYDNDQSITNYIAVFSDISKYKEKEELMYFQANFDPLTMLPNRSFFFYTLAERIDQLDEDSIDKLYLMHLDINGLARINENYNYNVGDTILLETSRRLKRIVAKDTVIARISGDNFVLLLGMQNNDFCLDEMAHQICDELSAPIEAEGLQVTISCNIGIASTASSTISTDNFYSMAEQALLKSKQEGDNLYFVYDDALQSEIKSRWELEQELTLAIKEDQFVLYYQPQVDSQTGKLLGVESLVRWQHPTKGLLAPGYFISLAEETGHIVELGNLILLKACQQIRMWSKQFQQKFTVSINISPRQFALEHTHQTIRNIIEEAQVDKSRIILEITEDVLMTDHGDLLEMLGDIRRSGIELSLDDFGTGFSSLSYLQQYPLTELKIDQSFVRSLGVKPESHTIVRAIIAMAKGLNLKVVAEGVETLLHKEILADLGCDVFQGYFFSRPVPAEKLTMFLTESC
ncbi:EAL domain-containing protein [Thalassotalea sp. G2M2-11]|uniref:putative bifunctional diguanylate cyclase/phosphodiesterase n=1 Tax=Thalassotalea sp. G2M2-11 TaxID=2787627 RepID=UPI0019D0E065|nr:EAL domain-containing protein [Thalassotalea sp. G2M2-11]